MERNDMCRMKEAGYVIPALVKKAIRQQTAHYSRVKELLRPAGAGRLSTLKNMSFVETLPSPLWRNMFR